MWIMWFILRFPARERRWRFCSPDEASRGAVPVQDANRLRSANLAMSPTSARVRAATTGPTPCRSISRDPRALTRTLSSAVAFFIFASTVSRSASSSAAILRRVLPARAEQLVVTVDDLDGGRELVGIDPDDHLRHSVRLLLLVPIGTARWAVLLRAGQSPFEPRLVNGARRTADRKRATPTLGGQPRGEPSAGHLDRVWPDTGPARSL